VFQLDCWLAEDEASALHAAFQREINRSASSRGSNSRDPVKEAKIRWIGAVRPSRQLHRSFLRMRDFLNAPLKTCLILRRPQGGRLEGRTIVMHAQNDQLWSVAP
jgi:hypothetical protein